MTEKLAININKINKEFTDKKVLNNISFDVKEGQIFGLVGINGAGKTTLIKIMLDLIKHYEGEIKIFNETTKLDNTRRHFVFLPEKFQPSAQLTGYEFLKLQLSYYKKEFDLKQAQKLCKALELDVNALSRRVSSYSKGMGQKLGLISSFLVKAPLLILDEPMSGLDPLARIKVKEQILNYKKEGGTIFFSSHILADIEEICDNIAILHKNKIAFLGKPEGLLKSQKQKNLEQAFLGLIN